MEATEALDRVVAALPGGGEPREGQRAMAAAVERALATERHLLVQAGTGTGKSIAYLIPAILTGRRVVVATATKALQDQLVGKDLPFLAAHLGQPFSFAALKGRSNYLCLQRARELLAGEQLGFEAVEGSGGRSAAERPVRPEVERLIRWATTTETGDRADLPFEPAPRTWAALSVGARECPGAARCPSGEACFAERARDAAAAADVVVVNQHLYGVHLASGGYVLPEHDIVVVDEAHQLEDVISSTAGMELSAGRFSALARAVRAIIADESLVAEVDDAGDRLAVALGEWVGRRVRRADADLERAIIVGRRRLDRVQQALRGIASDSADVATRKLRAQKLAGSLAEELDTVLQVAPTEVAWVEGPEHSPMLRVAPVDVAEALAPLWLTQTVVLTSATLPPKLPQRLGVPAATFDQLDVGSPFDYQTNALLYCAAHLPDPRAEAYEPALHDELEALITAAGGRTLALFTSWRAMTTAADELRPRLSVPVLTQSDLPKPALVAAFSDDEATCLFATMGFWQGVDVVGRALSLVTVDRLPFPRPDEPLLQARREQARGDAFAVVDLPRAATLLAQGAGRLIRSATDRGVVAVLDPRLASARYRWDIVGALPPMRRTRDRDETIAFLHEITASAD